jgi:hypothetical protein
LNKVSIFLESILTYIAFIIGFEAVGKDLGKFYSQGLHNSRVIHIGEYWYLVEFEKTFIHVLMILKKKNTAISPESYWPISLIKTHLQKVFLVIDTLLNTPGGGGGGGFNKFFKKKKNLIAKFFF